jgi:L-ascorbate metabolism protein UlaG (beta-lactamase superfamily)
VCRLTYVGHATVLVELAGARLLTDPLLRARIVHVRRRVPVPALEPLRDLDAVLISHAHADHLDVPSLRALGHTGPVVAPPGSARARRRAGLHAVCMMRPGERRSVGAVGIEAVEAAHDGRRRPVGPAVPALSFLLEGPVNVYFAGDTDLFDGMEELRGRVDVALLPIWGWGPRLPAGHLGPETAARALGMIRPSLAIPIHWGTMRSPGERSARDARAPAEAFAAAAARVARGTEVRILAPGQATDVGERVRP